MELLHTKIEILRKELIYTAFNHGFTAPKTLHISQELDKLHNLLLHNLYITKNQ
ncbi:Spo0E family sporulation regulatory protein-aspartic acid phosphatase [Peribacillus sp. NPDC097264]|uniref:Spo0E family sporulation regulatory protein-aspartic acid phosphatase n=1 Tax=unclassified Peribacillus TaxID=2675266 RepID=UPI0038131C16